MSLFRRKTKEKNASSEIRELTDRLDRVGSSDCRAFLTAMAIIAVIVAIAIIIRCLV